MLLVQVTALAAVPRVPLAAAALVLAEVTGRVSVVVGDVLPRGAARRVRRPRRRPDDGGGPRAHGRRARWSRSPPPA